MQKDLDQMHASLEHELATLRVAVRQLRVEYIRAQEIERAVEAEPNGPWLQWAAEPERSLRFVLLQIFGVRQRLGIRTQSRIRRDCRQAPHRRHTRSRARRDIRDPRGRGKTMTSTDTVREVEDLPSARRDHQWSGGGHPAASWEASQLDYGTAFAIKECFAIGKINDEISSHGLPWRDLL
jgi:hypothetical protein